MGGSFSWYGGEPTEKVKGIKRGKAKKKEKKTRGTGGSRRVGGGGLGNR